MRVQVNILTYHVASYAFQGDVALNLYDFVVRKPGRATEKYGLRAYDEIILAPMVRFISRDPYLSTSLIALE